MKAEDLIRDALLEIGQASATGALDAGEAATGIRYANRLFANNANLGLGFTVLDSLSDTVTIPTYAEEWAVKALAVRLANQFGPYDQIALLKDDERNARNAMMGYIVLDIACTYDSNTPVGSGNESQNSAKFYPEIDADIIQTETGNYITVE